MGVGKRDLENIGSEIVFEERHYEGNYIRFPTVRSKAVAIRTVYRDPALRRTLDKLMPTLKTQGTY